MYKVLVNISVTYWLQGEWLFWPTLHVYIGNRMRTLVSHSMKC